MKTILIVAALAATLSGCATKQYVHAAPVTQFETTTMSCREIDLEIAKTHGDEQAIATTAEFGALDVLGILGDWGIGNALAYHSAQKSVAARMTTLTDLRAARNCPITTAGVQ